MQLNFFSFLTFSPEQHQKPHLPSVQSRAGPDPQGHQSILYSNTMANHWLNTSMIGNPPFWSIVLFSITQLISLYSELKWPPRGCTIGFRSFLVSHTVLAFFHTLPFSCSVVSDSLGPRGLQDAGLPCPSPTPGLAQTHVHRISDAIQPSYPLSSPSPLPSIKTLIGRYCRV